MTTPQVLTTRELNRATLDRQLLLRRTRKTPGEVIEHLVGLQAQVPGNPYTALWTRIEVFDPQAFSRQIEDREIVRLSLHRSTIHIVTARDCLALRPVLQAPQERSLKGAFGRQLTGVDLERVVARGRELVEERPRSFNELGRILIEEWPGSDPLALAMAVRHNLALIQVPPRGLWQRGGMARHTTAEHWIGARQSADTAPDDLVLRYFAAFGPASVKDVQMWSGLTRLREVVDRKRARLRVFRDENGVELFDLPDAPRPAAGIPAPARFLPEYDNVFIGHADRERIASQESLRRAWRGNSNFPVFLSDGFIKGIWKLETDTKRTRATLAITPFGKLPRAERAALEHEGAGLLALHAPQGDLDIRWSTG